MNIMLVSNIFSLAKCFSMPYIIPRFIMLHISFYKEVDLD